MKKIISLFQRNYEGNRLVRDEIVPGAEWVIEGEGVATRKFDGACCAIIGGLLYKRYDAKQGKMPPDGFVPAQEPDSITGHWPGWVQTGAGPEDKWFVKAFNATILTLGGHIPDDGTYEAISPHFQGDAEAIGRDMLIAHGKHYLPDCPRSFLAIREWFKTQDIEGIVFHHPDGRMVKIKKKDFGLKRTPEFATTISNLTAQ